MNHLYQPILIAVLSVSLLSSIHSQCRLSSVQLINVDDEEGFSLKMEHDQNVIKRMIFEGDGETETFDIYYLDGNPTQITANDEAYLSLKYNSSDQLVQAKNYDRDETLILTNQNGRITSIEIKGENITASISYDSKGRMSKVSEDYDGDPYSYSFNYSDQVIENPLLLAGLPAFFWFDLIGEYLFLCDQLPYRVSEDDNGSVNNNYNSVVVISKSGGLIQEMEITVDGGTVKFQFEYDCN